MKKIIYGALIVSAIGTSIYSCKKELNNSVENDRIEYRLDKITEVQISAENNVSLKNESDLDEEKLNLQLIQLTNATKELIKDYHFNKLILKLAKESNTETVYLSELLVKGPEFYNAINSKLAIEKLSIELITQNMTHRPILPNSEFPETAQIEAYEPAILVPNVEIANKHLQAVISPNIESDYNEEDCIVAWYYDQSGSQKETIINEKTALETTNPIFIFNHAIPKAKMDKIGVFVDKIKKAHPNDETAVKTTTFFESREIQIKNGYGYESGLAKPKSEYCFTGCHVIQNSPPANFLYPDNFVKIREFTKSEVQNSTVVSVPTWHADNYLPYAGHKVYWNTFERDWNRSPISLGEGIIWTQNWVLYGKARYSSDWYSWIPNTTNIHETPFDWFGWTPSISYDNWKSLYKLYKVN